MVEAGRAGRLRGAGFYDYDESGTRGSIWPGLAELFPVADEQLPLRDIKDRMLFAEALETAKCFEEGVIESAAAANIGSIMGIGFPPHDRRRRAVHDRLPGPGDPTARSAWRPSSSAPTSSPRRTATGSRPPRGSRDLAAKGEALPGLSRRLTGTSAGHQ